MFGDITGFTSGGGVCSWPLMGGARDAVLHPPTPGAACHSKAASGWKSGGTATRQKSQLFLKVLGTHQ